MKKIFVLMMLLVCTAFSALAVASDGSEGHGVSAPPTAQASK